MAASATANMRICCPPTAGPQPTIDDRCPRLSEWSAPRLAITSWCRRSACYRAGGCRPTCPSSRSNAASAAASAVSAERCCCRLGGLIGSRRPALRRHLLKAAPAEQLGHVAEDRIIVAVADDERTLPRAIGEHGRMRSEERRVGEEGRSRRSPYH